MERVTGIGGFFFRAKDPRALAAWYDEHLGVTATPSDYDGTPWQRAAGATEYPNGDFATVHDPEGNPIQLWQPVGDTYSE